MAALKPHSLSRLFSRFFRPVDPLNGEDIENGWEYIEILDQELSGTRDEDASCDGVVSEHGDLYSIGSSKLKYTILSKAEVLQTVEDEITRFSTVFKLSRSEAVAILHHFKWSVASAGEDWLACEEKVRKAVGLSKKPVLVTPDAADRACRICNERFQGEMMLGVSCGHQFCRSCLTGYINKAIGDGPGCLAMRCPDPFCDASVGLDLIELLATDNEEKNIGCYLIKSCFTGGREAKLCPAPGCDYVVLLNADGDDCNVNCSCSYRFCWNCEKEAHSPVDCNTADKWMSEINVQSENWGLAHTKPCPTCGCTIEQNQGCRYLTCTLCCLKFCSFCGCQSSSHPAGDYQYSYCTQRGSLIKPTGYREEDQCERHIAMSSLMRYNRFYEGWISYESSRANAITDLKLLQSVHFEWISAIFGLREDELDFLVTAQLQVAECYQLLKWAYVYGYFMLEDENGKKRLFDVMQEQAKDQVELLAKQMKELDTFLQAENVYSDQLLDFCNKLRTLTRVAKNYFDRMVDALQTGLPEVVSLPRPSPTPLQKLNITRGSSSNPCPSATPRTVGECSDLESKLS